MAYSTNELTHHLIAHAKIKSVGSGFEGSEYASGAGFHRHESCDAGAFSIARRHGREYLKCINAAACAANGRMPHYALSALRNRGREHRRSGSEWAW